MRTIGDPNLWFAIEVFELSIYLQLILCTSPDAQVIVFKSNPCVSRVLRGRTATGPHRGRGLLSGAEQDRATRPCGVIVGFVWRSLRCRFDFPRLHQFVPINFIVGWSWERGLVGSFRQYRRSKMVSSRSLCTRVVSSANLIIRDGCDESIRLLVERAMCVRVIKSIESTWRI